MSQGLSVLVFHLRGLRQLKCHATRSVFVKQLVCAFTLRELDNGNIVLTGLLDSVVRKNMVDDIVKTFAKSYRILFAPIMLIPDNLSTL